MRKILLGVACIVALAPIAEAAITPFLDFPLSCPIAAQGKCSTTRYSKGAYAPASMASVLDHHMEKPYDEDGIVTAFTGEEGRATATKPKANQGCYPQHSPNPGKPFIIKGLYQGTNDGCLAEQGLNYDNHPAYDYIAEVGTPVYAAASGKVVKIINKATGLPGRCVPMGIETGGCGIWGYVGIDHGNGYVTQYGHLSRIDFVSGDEIKAGALIGLTGQSSPPVKDKNGNVIARYRIAPHFHFEVLKESKGSPYGYAFVDPYGWEGAPKNDPLEKATGIPNVRLWKTNATAASAGPNAAQTTPTTTPSVTTASMTLSDRLRGSPAYRRSFNAMFAGTPPTDRWLSRFLSGGGSVESPGSACDIGGRTYGYFNACEPHNCGANQIDVFFDANGSRAWARHVNLDSASSRFYGNPDRAMVSALEVAERRRRSGIFTPCEITPRPPASAVPNAAQTTPAKTPPRGLPVGKWEGPVEQPNSKRYSVTIDLENLKEGASGGSVIYPELNCRGTLRLLEIREDKLFFAEKIESGRCVDGGNIEIKLAQDNKLIWQWFYPNGTRGAYATLIRIDAGKNFSKMTALPINKADAIARTIEAVDTCYHLAGEDPSLSPERAQQLERSQKQYCPVATSLSKEAYAKYPNEPRLFEAFLRMSELRELDLPPKEINRMCSTMKDSPHCK